MTCRSPKRTVAEIRDDLKNKYGYEILDPKFTFAKPVKVKDLMTGTEMRFRLQTVFHYKSKKWIKRQEEYQKYIDAKNI